MSTIMEALPSWDAKRTVAHVFPGFLLFVGILMTSDTLSPGGYKITNGTTFTTMVLNPGEHTPSIETLILVGVFVGSILGIMLDGISHLFLEDLLFRFFLRGINTKEQNKFKELMHEIGITNRIGKPIADYLYPTCDKIVEKEFGTIKDSFVRDFYSYYEFYVNSSLSMFMMAFVIQGYMHTVFGIDVIYSLAASVAVFIMAILLMAAAVNTLRDYKNARIATIEGILTLQKNKE